MRPKKIVCEVQWVESSSSGKAIICRPLGSILAYIKYLV